VVCVVCVVCVWFVCVCGVCVVCVVCVVCGVCVWCVCLCVFVYVCGVCACVCVCVCVCNVCVCYRITGIVASHPSYTPFQGNVECWLYIARVSHVCHRERTHLEGSSKMVASYWSPVGAFCVDIFYSLALCKNRVRIPEIVNHIFHLSQPASFWCLHILCR